MASPYVKEDLPPYLDSTSEPPPLFDGTTRLYTYFQCPFAQRVWISRNYKGLQDKIKLVPIDLRNRPAWYKEKVYPENKVPSLEHNNKITGESLVLLKYLEDNFEGPKLLPNDPPKQQFAEELLAYIDTFTKTVYTSLKGDPVTEAGSAFDYLETALHKFEDGPFFLGQFSLVDIAYAPFVERFQIFLQDAWKYDITAGRPKLAAWIEELNKIDAYTQTKCNPEELIQQYKQRYLVDIAYAPFVQMFQIFLQDVWKYDITAGRPKLATWIEEMNKIDAYTETKCNPEELIQNYKQWFLVVSPAAA